MNNPEIPEGWEPIETLTERPEHQLAFLVRERDKCGSAVEWDDTSVVFYSVAGKIIEAGSYRVLEPSTLACWHPIPEGRTVPWEDNQAALKALEMVTEQLRNHMNGNIEPGDKDMVAFVAGQEVLADAKWPGWEWKVW